MFRDDFDGPSAYRQRSIDLPFGEIQSRQIVQAVRNIKMVRPSAFSQIARARWWSGSALAKRPSSR